MHPKKQEIELYISNKNELVLKDKQSKSTSIVKHDIGLTTAKPIKRKGKNYHIPFYALERAIGENTRKKNNTKLKCFKPQNKEGRSKSLRSAKLLQEIHT